MHITRWGNPEVEWCPGSESNRHAPFGAPDFKSGASASFATRALRRCKQMVTRVFSRYINVRTRQLSDTSAGTQASGRSVHRQLH